MRAKKPGSRPEPAHLSVCFQRLMLIGEHVFVIGHGIDVSARFIGPELMGSRRRSGLGFRCRTGPKVKMPQDFVVDAGC